MAQIIYFRTTTEIRWDQLAYIAYGDAGRAADLLQANPVIGVYNWIPEGVVVACPIILEAAVTPVKSLLPLWKQ